MAQYLVLLRGINVGGNNIIRMADLRVCLLQEGFANVATYIQSGNVLLEAPHTDETKLAARLNEVLAQTFNYRAPVVMRSHAQLREVVASAPEGFGSEPSSYRYDVIFLRAPLTAAEAIQSISVKEGVDEAAAGQGVLYFARLTRKATQSRLNRIVGMPIYQQMTIRNWNTTTKLLAMMDERAAKVG